MGNNLIEIKTDNIKDLIYNDFVKSNIIFK